MRDKKTIVDAFILAASERPDDFQIMECTMRDKKSGLEFWISNGFFFHGVYRPFEMKFGIIQGLRFAYYLGRLKAWKASQMLIDGKTVRKEYQRQA